MRELESCEDRLKAMVVFDKQDVSYKIIKVLKAEVLYLLNNFFDVCAEDLMLDLHINNDGKYELNIKLESRNMKGIHSFDC